MSVNLLSGLAQGFAQAHGEKLKEQQNEEIKKLQVKLFKQQLESQEQQKKAADQFLGFLNPTNSSTESAPQDLAQTQQPQDFGSSPTGLGGLQAEQARPSFAKKSLMDVLSSPEGQALAIKGGLMSANDIRTQGLMELLARRSQDGTGDLGAKVTLGPRGLEVSVDPNAAAAQRRADARASYEFGYPGSPSGNNRGGNNTGRPPSLPATQPGQVSPLLSPKQRADLEYEKEKLRPKAYGALMSAQQQHDRLTSSIEEAKSMVGINTAGPGGKLFSNVPGSEATDLKNLLMTIKSNVGFAQLQELRNNSPTGGALGNVSDNENKYLQSLFASLEQEQSPQALRKRLATVEQEVRASWARVRAAYEQDYGKLPDAQQARQPPKPGATVSGYTFTGGNPADPKNWKKEK